MPESGLWPTFGVADLANVDWTVVAGQVPSLLTVTLVTLLCLLVYLNGLEVATGVEVDLDREFAWPARPECAPAPEGAFRAVIRSFSPCRAGWSESTPRGTGS